MTERRPDHTSPPGGRGGSGGEKPAGTVPVSTSGRARATIALFLAGPVIWSVHFLVVYLAVETACSGGGAGLGAFGPSAAEAVTIVATVVAAVACLLAAAASHRRYRTDRTPDDSPTDLSPAEGVGTLAFIGFLLALLGFVTVLLVGVPALFLPACLP